MLIASFGGGAFIGTSSTAHIEWPLWWQSVVARADCGCGWRYVPVMFFLTAGGDGSSTQPPERQSLLAC